MPEDFAFLHHADNFAHGADVFQRITLNGNNIGQLCGFERSEFVFHVKISPTNTPTTSWNAVPVATEYQVWLGRVTRHSRES